MQGHTLNVSKYRGLTISSCLWVYLRARKYNNYSNTMSSKKQFCPPQLACTHLHYIFHHLRRDLLCENFAMLPISTTILSKGQH